MPHYRVYSLDPQGHFIGAHELAAHDDREAVKKAQQLLDRQDLELWDGGRLIARFDHERPWPRDELAASAVERPDTTKRRRMFNFVQTCWRQWTRYLPLPKEIDLREQSARLAKDRVEGSAFEALIALAAKSELATMSDHSPLFRMMLIARKAGWYGYIIGRYDELVWMWRSPESFPSMEEADKAGRRAMEMISCKISEFPRDAK